VNIFRSAEFFLDRIEAVMRKKVDRATAAEALWSGVKIKNVLL
jgi:hypothetical protein